MIARLDPQRPLNALSTPWERRPVFGVQHPSSRFADTYQIMIRKPFLPRRGRAMGSSVVTVAPRSDLYPQQFFQAMLDEAFVEDKPHEPPAGSLRIAIVRIERQRRRWWGSLDV